MDFTEIMSRELSQAEKEDQFALEALRKIPAQYSAIIGKWIRYVYGETQYVLVRCSYIYARLLFWGFDCLQWRDLK